MANNIKDRGEKSSPLSIDMSACKKTEGRQNIDAATCAAAAEDAKLKCQMVVDQNGEIEVGAGQDNTRRWVSIGAGAAASAGTFFLVRKAIRDAKETKRTQAEQDAYDKFMREIGDHIYCFIGADEAGNYGDLIEISVD